MYDIFTLGMWGISYRWNEHANGTPFTGLGNTNGADGPICSSARPPCLSTLWTWARGAPLTPLWGPPCWWTPGSGSQSLTSARRLVTSLRTQEVWKSRWELAVDSPAAISCALKLLLDKNRARERPNAVKTRRAFKTANVS